MSSDEDPFELIRKGNSFEAACDYWRSAECYSRSSIGLRCRADDLSFHVRNGSCGDSNGVVPRGRGSGGGQDNQSTKLARQRIITLYRAQSLEYMYKARHCLLEALKFENDQDRARVLEVAKSGNGALDPICSLISQEDRRKRNELFRILFSGHCEAYSNDHDVICTSDNMNHATGRESNQGQGLNDFSSSNSIAIDSAFPADNEALIQPQLGNPLLLTTQAHRGDQRDSRQTLIIDPSVGMGTSQTNSGEENCTKSSSSMIDDEIDFRQQSIESRLAKLDSSLLPSVHKSCSRSRGEGESDDRINEIKHGLGRLGISLPESTRKNNLMQKHLSTDGQVKLIIEQVSDAVRIERGLHIYNGGKSYEYADEHTCINDDEIDENNSMFEGFEDDEYDIDALLTMAENLVAKSGVKQDGKGVFSTQVMQIKRIQALLLEARLCLELNPGLKDGDERLQDGSISEDSVGNDDCARGSTSIMKNKAEVLIENALVYMKELLRHW